jgi:Sortase domain
MAASLAGAVALDVVAAPSGWLNIDGNIQFAGGGGTVDWANSGAAGAACANGGVNMTGSGGLFNCGRPGAVGAPPIAPTLTPAAAADPTIISTDFVVDPISGDSAGCGGDDPTTLTGGGPKNGDPIGSYTVGAGTVPGKTELSNVYAVAHTKANGHPEVYFGAERLVNNGDSHMDFEFLQSSIGRTAACGGGFTGHRSEGDVLIAIDFTNGGALAGFSVWQWHCAPVPAPQPADGTVCDPTGVQLYEQIAVPAFAAVTVNAAEINCGGWVCRDQVTGNSTRVATNDFLEGGIDLQGIPFTGCLRTFLPHTRTAQSFTSVLKDFAGPVSFKSCKDPATTSNSAPSGGGVAAGSTATDTVNVTNGGAGLDPAGTMTFFLCNPGQVTAGGCVSGGAQVGAVKTIAGGSATSDPSAGLQFNGKWCWRTAYTPDPSLAGVYEPATHTNATSECFTVINGIFLPDTGLPDIPTGPLLPIALLVLPVALLGLPWRNVRSVAVLLVAGLVVAASPAPSASQPHAAGAAVHQYDAALAPAGASPSPLELGHVTAREPGWRLVIPRIGVDAPIVPVGVDRAGAMAVPPSLDSVGWFNRGPSPGQPGSAVIDGHYGASQPAVFRALRLLRPGDEIQVVWPNGRIDSFQVATKETVPLDAHPAGLFTRTGAARLSLITCSGPWIDSSRTYSDRLIVTATLT